MTASRPKGRAKPKATLESVMGKYRLVSDENGERLMPALMTDQTTPKPSPGEATRQTRYGLVMCLRCYSLIGEDNTAQHREYHDEMERRLACDGMDYKALYETLLSRMKGVQEWDTVKLLKLVRRKG